MLPLLTPEDFATDQEVRWCPGCGDFAILAALKQVLAGLGTPREQLVFFSGLGCASRLPYYLSTYGFHGVHGAAPALATGLKLARPELQIWVVTGDGDALSVGSNHLLHALRRNVDIKILLFNNEVLGLTKGQYSPTSRVGTRTRTSPDGSVETPLRPVALALAAEATFVARTLDVDIVHLTGVLRRAAAHTGAALVEIYQNCKIFNDGVFEYATDPASKAEATLFLEHGQPLRFGKDRQRGLCLNAQGEIEAAQASGGAAEGLLSHDETAANPCRALELSRLTGPELPECFGVFRAVQRPTFEQQLLGSIRTARAAGPGNLGALLAGDEAWTIA